MTATVGDGFTGCVAFGFFGAASGNHAGLWGVEDRASGDGISMTAAFSGAAGAATTAGRKGVVAALGASAGSVQTDAKPTESVGRVFALKTAAETPGAA